MVFFSTAIIFVTDDDDSSEDEVNEEDFRPDEVPPQDVAIPEEALAEAGARFPPFWRMKQKFK